MVEVDGFLILEISKFNYLLELVKEKFKDDIYKEVKWIFE